MFHDHEGWRFCSDDTQADYANLPPEILITIFQYLKFYDIQAARLVCKSWFAVTKVPQFDSKGVYKISSAYLDINYPGADMIFTKRIQDLHLKSVQYGDVDKLFKHLSSSLKSLTLKLVPIATSLNLIMQHFPKLHTLKISKIKLPPFLENIENLGTGDLSGLRELHLVSNESCVNKYVLNCLSKRDTLERLTIEFFYQDEQDLLKVLTRHSNSLKGVELRFFEGRSLQTREWVKALQELTLHEFSIQGSFSGEIIKSGVTGKRLLRSVDVIGSVQVGDDLLLMMSRTLLQLERLHLGYCGRITDVGVSYLTKLTKLTVLDLSSCNIVTKLGVSSFIGPSINLNMQELNLTELDLDEPLIYYIAAKLPNLRKLNLTGCGKAVTNRAIQEVFDKLRKLEELWLDNCNSLTDIGMLGLTRGASIQNLKSLHRLSLRGCKQLSDVTLICGLKVPQLKFLNIAQCDGITNTGLESLLENCSTLEEMWLSRTKSIDYKGIRTLTHGLGRLRVITINNCGDIAQLVSANWKQSRFRTYPNELSLRRCH